MDSTRAGKKGMRKRRKADRLKPQPGMTNEKGRVVWFHHVGLPFYKLRIGEWFLSAFVAVGVAGLIAIVAGSKPGAMAIVVADFLMVFGFSASAFSFPRSSSHADQVMRFKIVAILSLMLVHFTVQLATAQA